MEVPSAEQDNAVRRGPYLETTSSLRDNQWQGVNTDGCNPHGQSSSSKEIVAIYVHQAGDERSELGISETFEPDSDD
jgi:hypothetical protein